MKKLINFLTSFGFVLVLLVLVVSKVSAQAKMSFNQAVVMWKSVNGAKYYNIYYKETGQQKYTHAVRNLPSSSTMYTIGFLKKGVTYWYTLSAVDYNGKEFWMSSPKKLMSMMK